MNLDHALVSQVFVRVRPINGAEASEGKASISTVASAVFASQQLLHAEG